MSSFERIATLVLALFCLHNTVAGDPGLTVVSRLCNNQGFGGLGDPADYHNALENVFQDLITRTPFSDYNRYCTFDVGDGTSFYGHGACNGVINRSDCANCLIAAAGRIRAACPSSIGAAYQLKDCRLRYEIYPFTE